MLTSQLHKATFKLISTCKFLSFKGKLLCPVHYETPCKIHRVLNWISLLCFQNVPNYLNWDLSFSNLKNFPTQQRSRTSAELWLSQVRKGQTSILGFFRWKLTIVHKIESNKELMFKKNFHLSKFPIFKTLVFFDLNLLEKWWTKTFNNGL